MAHLTPAWHSVSLILIAFGALTVAVASLSMLPRGNVKKLIAFSSVEHMGFLLVGIGLGTPLVLFWVLFHILAHALVKTQLFFSSGILHQQYHSNQFEDMKDIFTLQPLATWGLITGSMAIIGVPFFPVFLSKLNILIQLCNFSLPLLFFILLCFLLVVAAFAAILIRTIPQTSETKPERYRASASMRLPIIVLFAAIVMLGVYFPTGLHTMLTKIVSSLGF